MKGPDIQYSPASTVSRLSAQVHNSSFDPFPANLTDEERGGFCAYARPIEIKKRQILYCQGERYVRVYMVMKGAVKLMRYSTDGREQIIDVVGAEGLFGKTPEMVDDDTAVVVENGIVAVIDGDVFERLEHSASLLTEGIKRVIGLRKNRAKNALIDLLNSTVEQRLARTLLRLLDDFCEPRHDGFLVKVGLTHKDFADLIASTRETVTLKMNKFRKYGLIAYEGRFIVVRSIGEMRNVAEL